VALSTPLSAAPGAVTASSPQTVLVQTAAAPAANVQTTAAPVAAPFAAVAPVVTESPSAPATDAQARALSGYFTNGAAATSVPSEGPGAAYFTNGAAALSVPTSVIPSDSFDVSKARP
jgi:hypothetical protein